MNLNITKSHVISILFVIEHWMNDTNISLHTYIIQIETIIKKKESSEVLNKFNFLKWKQNIKRFAHCCWQLFTIFKCLVMPRTVSTDYRECMQHSFNFAFQCDLMCVTFKMFSFLKTTTYLFQSSHIVSCFACDALINCKSDLLTEMH